MRIGTFTWPRMLLNGYSRPLFGRPPFWLKPKLINRTCPFLKQYEWSSATVSRLSVRRLVDPEPSVLLPQKTAIAVAQVTAGKGMIRVNGFALDTVQPEALRYKLYDPFHVVGKERFAGLDIRIKVNGGGQVSQIYAIRQAIARGVVAYYHKYVDEASKMEIKAALTEFDRTLLVSDPRRKEAKKFDRYVHLQTILTSARVPVRATRSPTVNFHKSREVPLTSVIIHPVAFGGTEKRRLHSLAANHMPLTQVPPFPMVS